ncbi:hypothetical protein CWO91_16610 [Bradyrhizobium genosp. SA-3]|uniref:hypothetical protein n=1 Tax=Bradyrhizobium genosp. SA-3 TaxID=508868 RepID=UPI001028C9A1|nr:hypothetical protein [Bradyrhizobium genosp. SA-3]RZN09649.1 hypothetical protein CWO91_16610 [Bradyrhizobium genosp. SA-3]
MTNDNEKIVPFKPKLVTPESKTSPTPNLDIVATLEEYLAMARKGELQFVAFAYVNHEGVGYSAWSPAEDLDPVLNTSAIGAVSFLNARFLDSAIAGSVDEA